MSKLHFDWNRDLSEIDLDRERTLAAQNIVTLTEKLIAVESSIRDGTDYEGLTIPFAEKLATILRRELEKEYEYVDLFDKIEALRDLGVV